MPFGEAHTVVYPIQGSVNPLRPQPLEKKNNNNKNDEQKRKRKNGSREKPGFLRHMSVSVTKRNWERKKIQHGGIMASKLAVLSWFWRQSYDEDDIYDSL